jgi:hypothetical protein
VHVLPRGLVVQLPSRGAAVRQTDERNWIEEALSFQRSAFSKPLSVFRIQCSVFGSQLSTVSLQ